MNVPPPLPPILASQANALESGAPPRPFCRPPDRATPLLDSYETGAGGSSTFVGLTQTGSVLKNGLPPPPPPDGISFALRPPPRDRPTKASQRRKPVARSIAPDDLDDKDIVEAENAAKRAANRHKRRGKKNMQKGHGSSDDAEFDSEGSQRDSDGAALDARLAQVRGALVPKAAFEAGATPAVAGTFAAPLKRTRRKRVLGLADLAARRAKRRADKKAAIGESSDQSSSERFSSELDAEETRTGAVMEETQPSSGFFSFISQAASNVIGLVSDLVTAINADSDSGKEGQEKVNACDPKKTIERAQTEKHRKPKREEMADSSSAPTTTLSTDEAYFQYLGQFCTYLGVDVKAEPNLIDEVDAYLKRELPDGWSTHQTTGDSEYGAGYSYFVDEMTGRTQWTRPDEEEFLGYLSQRAKKPPTAGSRLYFAALRDRSRHARFAAAQLKALHLPDRRPLLRALPPDVTDPSSWVTPAGKQTIIHVACLKQFPVLHPAALEAFAAYFGLGGGFGQVLRACELRHFWIPKLAALCPVPAGFTFCFDEADASAAFVEVAANTASPHHPLDAFFAGLLERMLARFRTFESTEFQRMGGKRVSLGEDIVFYLDCDPEGTPYWLGYGTHSCAPAPQLPLPQAPRVATPCPQPKPPQRPPPGRNVPHSRGVSGEATQKCSPTALPSMPGKAIPPLPPVIDGSGSSEDDDLLPDGARSFAGGKSDACEVGIVVSSQPDPGVPLASRSHEVPLRIAARAIISSRPEPDDLGPPFGEVDVESLTSLDVTASTVFSNMTTSGTRQTSTTSLERFPDIPLPSGRGQARKTEQELRLLADEGLAPTIGVANVPPPPSPPNAKQNLLPPSPLLLSSGLPLQGEQVHPVKNSTEDLVIGPALTSPADVNTKFTFGSSATPAGTDDKLADDDSLVVALGALMAELEGYVMQQDESAALAVLSRLHNTGNITQSALASTGAGKRLKAIQKSYQSDTVAESSKRLLHNWKCQVLAEVQRHDLEPIAQNTTFTDALPLAAQTLRESPAPPAPPAPLVPPPPATSAAQSRLEMPPLPVLPARGSGDEAGAWTREEGRWTRRQGGRYSSDEGSGGDTSRKSRREEQLAPVPGVRVGLGVRAAIARLAAAHAGGKPQPRTDSSIASAGSIAGSIDDADQMKATEIGPNFAELQLLAERLRTTSSQGNLDEIVDVLEALEQVPATVQQLRDTQLGILTQPLKDHFDKRVRTVARRLRRKWKDIIQCAGNILEAEGGPDAEVAFVRDRPPLRAEASHGMAPPSPGTHPPMSAGTQAAVREVTAEALAAWHPTPPPQRQQATQLQPIAELAPFALRLGGVTAGATPGKSNMVQVEKRRQRAELAMNLQWLCRLYLETREQLYAFHQYLPTESVVCEGLREEQDVVRFRTLLEAALRRRPGRGPPRGLVRLLRAFGRRVLHGHCAGRRARRVHALFVEACKGSEDGRAFVSGAVPRVLRLYTKLLEEERARASDSAAAASADNDEELAGTSGNFAMDFWADSDLEDGADSVEETETMLGLADTGRAFSSAPCGVANPSIDSRFCGFSPPSRYKATGELQSCSVSTSADARRTAVALDARAAGVRRRFAAERPFYSGDRQLLARLAKAPLPDLDGLLVTLVPGAELLTEGVLLQCSDEELVMIAYALEQIEVAASKKLVRDLEIRDELKSVCMHRREYLQILDGTFGHEDD